MSRRERLLLVKRDERRELGRRMWKVLAQPAERFLNRRGRADFDALCGEVFGEGIEFAAATAAEQQESEAGSGNDHHYGAETLRKDEAPAHAQAGAHRVDFLTRPRQEVGEQLDLVAEPEGE